MSAVAARLRQLIPLLKQPLVWLPALMFALLAASLLTQHHEYGPKMVGKYQKLLYVLPLALFFSATPGLSPGLSAVFCSPMP